MTESEIFTSKATVDFPHVTPLQREELLFDMMKAIAGVLYHHTQIAPGKEQKEFTVEDVNKYIEKLKNGEIKPKTPGKRKKDPK